MCSFEGCKNTNIVNKKYELCEKHNWLRMNPNKTEADFFNRYQFRQNKNLKTPSIQKNDKAYFLKRTSLKSVSKKEQINKTKLNEIYKEIDRKRGLICEGCGNKNYLSHSHLISRNDRKDLEADENNIKIHCMQRMDGTKGCHGRWEGSLKEKQSLLDFEQNMEYIKNVDIKIYNKILFLK
jgi:hypothetical protein